MHMYEVPRRSHGCTRVPDTGSRYPPGAEIGRALKGQVECVPRYRTRKMEIEIRYTLYRPPFRNRLLLPDHPANSRLNPADGFTNHRFPG